MVNRQNLSDLLKGVGIKNVYFQPPPSLKMEFPCAVYERVRINTRFANNKPYKLIHVYQVTYITTDPDSPIPDRIGALPRCAFERHYEKDNKYYDVFRIT